MIKNSYSFFCPAYYDEENIELVVKKATDFFSKNAKDYEIVIVEDGSPDNTGKVCDELAKKYPKVKVVHHKKNLGYGAALRDGFKYANKFEYICFTDGDNQYNVDDFQKMLHLLPEYDLIMGARQHNANNKMRIFISSCYHSSLRLLFGIKFKDVSAALRIVKRNAINKIRITGNGPFTPAEIVIKLHKAGFKIASVPIDSYPRLHGKSTSLKPKNFINTVFEILNVFIQVKLNRYKKYENK